VRESLKCQRPHSDWSESDILRLRPAPARRHDNVSCAGYCHGHTAINSRKLRILIFSSQKVTHFNLSGLIYLLNGLQCRYSVGLGQHTRLSSNSRLIKHHAVRFHLRSHDPCSCYCPVSHTDWPLWLCAGQIDLQRVFIRKLLFLVSPSRQLQIARDSYWLGPAGVVTLPSTGCQTGYGTCTVLTSGGGSISRDGSCGGSKGYTCLGSVFGNCCSQYDVPCA
jgi:hypothetical protein